MTFSIISASGTKLLSNAHFPAFVLAMILPVKIPIVHIILLMYSKDCGTKEFYNISTSLVSEFTSLVLVSDFDMYTGSPSLLLQ